MDNNSPIAPVTTETPRVSPDLKPQRRGCLPVFVGVLLVLVGIPMLVCPGPGMAAIVAGVGMIAAGLGIKKTQ